MSKQKKKQTGYFLDREEKAVVDYNNASSFEERNRIFNEILEPALTTMVESIIRRYRLFVKDETFEETFDDALAFIIMKINQFKPENGRAYSYLGTMCRNYLIGRITKSNKEMVRDVSFDDVYEDVMGDSEYIGEIQ